MIKRTIAFTTNKTEYMDLHDDGCITRPEINMNVPSVKWKVIGAVELNNFGNAVRRFNLKDILNNPKNIPWKHANGKQRVFIMDMDHGTQRQWTNDHEVF